MSYQSITHVALPQANEAASPRSDGSGPTAIHNEHLSNEARNWSSETAPPPPHPPPSPPSPPPQATLPETNRPSRPQRIETGISVQPNANTETRTGAWRIRSVKKSGRTVIKATRVHNSFAPFRPVITRGPSERMLEDPLDVDHAAGLAKRARNPKSTLDDIGDWLVVDTQDAVRPDPLEGLFRVIHSDIVGLVEGIRSALEDIRERSIDTSVLQLQEYVLYWRSLLNRFHYELSRVLHKLLEFVRFAYFAHGPRADFAHYSDKLPAGTRGIIEDAQNQIRDTMKQVDTAYKSLRADIAIVDARRSIAEAESVSKLTELAFIFIPMTFAASVFSMQVKELSSPVPVAYFIGISIGFITLAYALRLTVRSSEILDFKRACFAQAREHAEISEGDPISTRDFLRWALPQIARKILSVCSTLFEFTLPFLTTAILLVLLMLPIIFLWLRGLNTGYSIVITLVVLPLNIALTWAVVSYASDEYGWEWFGKRIAFRRKRRRGGRWGQRRRRKGRRANPQHTIDIAVEEEDDEEEDSMELSIFAPESTE